MKVWVISRDNPTFLFDKYRTKRAAMRELADFKSRREYGLSVFLLKVTKLKFRKFK